MKRKALITVLVVLAVLVLLLLVDFRLLRGQFNAEHQVFTSTFGAEGPQEIAQNQDVDLYVLGTNWLTRGMVRPLIGALEKNIYIGKVNLCEGTPQKSNRPVIVVRVDQADLLWAVLYGRATVKLHMNYSSNGDIDWMDDEVIASYAGPYTKWMGGDFTTTSSAFGLMSLPGYTSYVGQYSGERISQAVEDSLRAK